MSAALTGAIVGWFAAPGQQDPANDLLTLTPFVSNDVGKFFTVRGFEIEGIKVPSLDPPVSPTRVSAKVIVDFSANGATTYQDLPPIPMRAVLSYGWHVIRIEPYGMRKQPGA